MSATAFTKLAGGETASVGVVVAPPPLTIAQPNPFGSPCRDAAAAVAFAAHVLIVGALAAALGLPAVRADSSVPPPASTGMLDVSAPQILRAVLVAAGASAAVAVVMFEVLRRLGGALIRAALLLSVALQVVAGGALLAAGVAPAGALFLATACLTLVYFGCVRSRIPFAAAHVSIAVAALARAPGLAVVALGCLAAQVAWSAVWALAALGVENSLNSSPATEGSGSSSGAAGIVATFLMLLSYFWGSVFIRNVSAFCAASVVGSYWWHGETVTSPTSDAARRALSTSCGTLSLSALLVAVAEATKAMARAAADRSRNQSLPVVIFAFVALCISSIFAAFMRFVNRWAVVFAALTGASLTEAGHAVLDLFTSRGFDAIINDDLVATALGLASVGAAAIGAVAGGAVAYLADSSEFRTAHAIIATVLAFCIGLMLASVMASFIETATRAVFVAWALSPGSLAATHRADFDMISAAWRTAHPQALEAAGYSVLYVVQPATVYVPTALPVANPTQYHADSSAQPYYNA